ncbi:DEAD/DEAH box helicase [Actinoplanes hulinensis]|uniref:DEAD/DEAH box helicase n=1 Tax=Actinoplanes hulinensis TaxID=1144547 RepID=A0ABS7BB48_9ACTN|nr:DEAD/DEAH box helicase [Actinoplanes hulinensis]MBW6438298.1 DEAD/DEAH box helicase [Actinoplanes hulinensis]
MTLVPESAEISLQLSFDVTRTRVVLRSSGAFRDEFARLVGLISAGDQTGPLTAEIGLDDFLAGVGELATWPDQRVQWDEALANLVTDVLDDADTAQERLSHAELALAPGGIAPGEVDTRLGGAWVGELTSFQRRDIASLLALRHGANFSVPGAGKTRVALAVFAAMRELGEAHRLLVIGPKSAYEAWESESSVCFKEPLRTSIMGSSPDVAAEVLIVNYERLGRAVPGLSAWLRASPAMVVLDEAHRMKLGASGAYGSACLALGPLANRRLILTGTPAPNGARDLESLLSFVWPGHGKRVVADAVGGGDLAYASSVLRPLFTRTTKGELGLPPVTTRIRYVDLPPLHREIYEALKGNPSARAGDLEALGKAMLRMLMAATSPALLVEGTTRYEPLAYQVPALEAAPNDSLGTLLANLPRYELSPKYEEAVRIVAENAGQKRKTLVWTTFVRSITTLERLLAPFQPAVVHGGTPNRDEQITRFREDPNCLVLISNPATLGEGISLHHECHDALFVDRDFMAGRFLQSLDRIHRLGLPPETETRVTVLAARGTVDEVVAYRLEEKLEFMGSILDDPAVRQLGDLQEEADPGVGGMDAADVRALLAHLNGT